MITEDEIKHLIEEADEGPGLDYKLELILETDGDKAQFVKDVLSLANSGGIAHIIVGIEDGTRKLLGIKKSCKVEQLNQILKDKSDPSLRLEYIEKRIMGHTVGVVEIAGENRPYIVTVPDRYGGPLSSGSQKQFYIERGTVFVRNHNMNEGARRADLDEMYQVKYVALQADVHITHEVTIKPSDGVMEVDIKFFLRNLGEVQATDTFVFIQFKNVKEIVKCKVWEDISNLNNNVPTVQLSLRVPVVRPVQMAAGEVVVKVDSAAEQIETRVIISAANMRTKEGSYVIPLKEKAKNVQ